MLWYTQQQTPNVRFSMKVNKQLFTGKSAYQQIDIFENDEMGRFLIIDGIVMFTSKDEFIYHDMIVHVPMATNPNIKKVLVIGGGDGGTVRELTRYSTVESIQMVELDRMVVEACREYIPLTAGRLDDPRVQLLYEDGIHYVRRAQDTYDLIIVDSTDPISHGEGLFSTEFYERCYALLGEEGILVNQCESPFYEKNHVELRKAVSKIKALFPITEFYQYHMPTYPSGHWIFGFASKKYDPIRDFRPDQWNALGIETQYYNTEVHLGSFMLPSYVKKMIENPDR